MGTRTRKQAKLPPTCLALCALHLAVLVYHVAATVAFPYDLDYGEGYVLNDAARLARGEPIYVDLQQFPMVRSPYPPLFPALWATTIPFTGPVFWTGRLLTAVALAGTLGLLAWNGWRLRLGRLPLALAVCALAASPLAYQWAAYARVDALALLFSVGAVLVAQWVAGWRGVLAAAALSVLALATKQTSVAAPAAVALALFARRPSHGMGFVVLVAAPTLLLAGWMESSSGGQFSRHVLLGNAQNPLFPARLLAMYGTFAALHLPLLLLVGWWVVRMRRGVPSPIALYVPISLALALSVGNGGSSVNYFLEPLAAAGLALPFAWRALGPTTSSRSRPATVRPELVEGREQSPLPRPPRPSHARSEISPPPLPVVLAALQLLLLLHWPNAFGTGYLPFAPHGRTPTSADYAAGAAVDTAVRAERRAVLAEPAGFAVRNGLPVYVQPIDLRAEAALGRWSSAPLLSALASGQFGLVITAYNLLPVDAERLLASERFQVERVLAGENGLVFRLLRPAGG